LFKNTLKYLQSNEFLLDVDLWRLFANLEELNKKITDAILFGCFFLLTWISLSFLKTFFETVKELVSKSDSPMDFSSMLKKGDLCQTHQIYCLNYTSTAFYLENLRQREDFGIYLKLWCEQNEQCERLRLPELLIAPLHRQLCYPLLLQNICKQSTEGTEKGLIQSLKEKVEKSIRDLEGKVKWLDNFQKIRQLQEVIIWPQVRDSGKRFFLPECLKQSLKENSSENILSSANTLLLHKGRLTLAGNQFLKIITPNCFVVFFSSSKTTRLIDIYLFLFDDFPLITEIKCNKKVTIYTWGARTPVNSCLLCPHSELQSFRREGGFFTVLGQPILLDRLILKTVDSVHITATCPRTLKHLHKYHLNALLSWFANYFFLLQKTWMSQIETAVSNYTTQHETKKSTAFCFPGESSEI
ncbi:PKHG7 protein, partial [Trogon melanurus]|nr:PKHG7 protein [Trogon melanurus]